MSRKAWIAGLAALLSAALALAQQAPGVPKGGAGQPKGPGGGGPVAGAGPRCDETRVAVSQDGLSFRPEGPVALSQASVPEGVRTPSGVRFYYVNGGSRHGMYVARNHDGVWERGDEVLLDGVFNGNAVDPDAVLLPDGRIRLYYFEGNFVGAEAVPGGAQANVASPFFAAISADGVHFTVEGKVFEVNGGTDPSVVRLANGAWLLAAARAQTQDMIIARSDDGLRFTELTTLKSGGIPELAVLDDGRVRLFFNNSGMQSRISADGGRTWTDEPGTRLQWNGFASDPSVVRLQDGTWRMFFKTIDQYCQAAVLQARGMQGGGPGGGPGQPPQPPGGGFPKGPPGNPPR